jgi:hypothetical protein
MNYLEIIMMKKMNRPELNMNLEISFKHPQLLKENLFIVSLFPLDFSIKHLY